MEGNAKDSTGPIVLPEGLVFESVGLNDAKARLSNIVGCSVPKAESTVYEKLRKRRNQAVHFYHPADLKSEKKVAVEQLSGWHFLRKRLSVTWKDCFASFAERIETLHRRMIGREDYYPAIFDEVRAEIEARSKGRLRSVCPTCRHPSVFTQGKVLSAVHRMECLVCETESFAVFLPCECGKLAPRSYEQEAKCQWCGKTNPATPEEAFTWAEKAFTQSPAAWCGVCGFMTKPSVIEVDSKSLCLGCFTFEEHSGVCRCEWCGDSVTGEIGDRFNPGCIRCGFHIETEADVEPALVDAGMVEGVLAGMNAATHGAPHAAESGSSSLCCRSLASTLQANGQFTIFGAISVHGRLETVFDLILPDCLRELFPRLMSE